MAKKLKRSVDPSLCKAKSTPPSLLLHLKLPHHKLLLLQLSAVWMLTALSPLDHVVQTVSTIDANHSPAVILTWKKPAVSDAKTACALTQSIACN